ncbi:MAG: SRPBCC domain-containing protein [Bacteroidota bacterium]
MQIIESTIIINAPVDKVWNILMEKDRYHLWNPFTPKIETTFEVGSDIILHVNMNLDNKILKQKEQILWIKEKESVAWGISSPFPVKTERAQVLTALSPTQTQYYTYDKFWGILVPLVMLLYRTKIQKGFDAVASGLKNFAEEKN